MMSLIETTSQMDLIIGTIITLTIILMYLKSGLSQSGECFNKNLKVVNNEMIITKLYSIKCTRCSQYIYHDGICYDNITKEPFCKDCLKTIDRNTEKTF